MMNPDDKLRALSLADGHELWVRGLKARDIAGIADGLVYASGGSHVEAIDAASGKAVWSFKTRGIASSRPLIAGGKVFVATRPVQNPFDLGKKKDAGHGFLYAIDARTGKIKQ